MSDSCPSLPNAWVLLLPDRARLFFERFMLPRKTIQLVATAQDRGIDVEKILQEILYPIMKDTDTST